MMIKVSKFLKLSSMLMSALALTVGCSNQKAPKIITIGFSQVGEESNWRTANSVSIKQAAKDYGINLQFSDAANSQEDQIKAIRSFIAQRVDFIAFSPTTTSGWETVLREAKRAKIPVILTDRGVDVHDSLLYVTLLGSDFKLEGVRAGEWLVDYMNMAGRGRKNINIVELQGTIGSDPAIQRQSGFMEVINKFPNYKVIRSEPGDFTRAQGKEVMKEFLKAEKKNINVLFSHNDDMAIGAIEAIEEYGLKPGKDIIIVSIDGVKGAFEAMMAGKLNCSVECSPLLGPQLMQAAIDLRDGKTIPRRVLTQEGVFQAEIAAKELPNRKY